MLIQCPNCKQWVDSGYITCQRCGKSILQTDDQLTSLEDNQNGYDFENLSNESPQFLQDTPKNTLEDETDGIPLDLSDNSPIDLMPYYNNGNSKYAEKIIKYQPDRPIYMMGKLTTGRAILEYRKRVFKIVLWAGVIIPFLITIIATVIILIAF